MTGVAFECIAELDLGQSASVSITADAYREIFKETLAAADFVVLLESEITSDLACPLVSQRIDLKQGVSNRELYSLAKQARTGYRMAFVVSSAESVLRLLESRGYERSETTTRGSAAVIHGWTGWLDRHVPGEQAALVFGHDYEPVFVFDRIKRD